MISHRKSQLAGSELTAPPCEIALSKVNRKLFLKQGQNRQTVFAGITGTFLSAKSQDRFQPQTARIGADRDPLPALFPPSLACRDCLPPRRRLGAADRAPALSLQDFGQDLLGP